MSVTANRVRAGFFLDSVALMRLSRSLLALPGVEDAALMMGTPANRELLGDAGLLADEGAAASGGDLVLAVRAGDETQARAALEHAETLLRRPGQRAAGGDDWHPRTLRSATRLLEGANLALISVPGDFAAAEARKALRQGLHVMIFSDNVPLEAEVALKQEARQRGLLVMGPDCGTAIVGGVPLAFANRVAPGDIGIVGASGTGMQEVSCLVCEHGGGISHALGVGGRDLGEAVGGISTLMALRALMADPATRHIVLISKPPAPAVAARVGECLAGSDKTFTLCLIGAREFALPPNAAFAPTLKEAAAQALGKRLGERFDPAALAVPARGPSIRGLFAGGTLAAEAQVVLLAAGQAVASNAPVPGASALDGAPPEAHRLLDLGDDAYTRGRPHPMIDPGVRDGPLRAALADPLAGVVLLDTVLGYGACDDPAGHLAEVLEAAPAPRPTVVASVTGTRDDPQGRAGQIERLRAAGVLVAPSNADAAALALACVAARC